MEIETHRIGRLEERIDRTEEKVTSIDKSLAVYSAIFEKNLQIQERLTGSIDKLSENTVGLRNTLIKMQSEMERSFEEQEKNRERISRLEENTNRQITSIQTQIETKIGVLKKEVDDVDEKGKLDILKIIKDNFLTILFSIYIIYDAVQKYILPLSNNK